MFRRRAASLLTILATILVSVVVQRPVVGYADTSANGGDYVPFTRPVGILDTRDGLGGATGQRGPGSTTTFPVLGVGGIPSTNVNALLVRLTAAGPTTGTWLNAYPDGEPGPGTTMLNVAAGETLSNTAIVRPGANGRLAVFNGAGKTHVLVDVQGYFTTGTGSTWGGLVPVTQSRVVDTRDDVGTEFGAIPAGGRKSVNLATAGVPVGASAVYVTLTVPNPGAAGWMAAGPAGGPVPSVGVINYENGINSVSGAAIKLAADGKVTFYNNGSAPAHLVVDTLAYFTANPTQGAGYRHASGRLLSTSVAANATVDVTVSGTNGLPTRGVAGAALSVHASGTASGTLRVWPTGSTEPGTTLTYHQANVGHRTQAIIKPGTEGRVRVHNLSSAAATVTVDLEGWFSEQIPGVPVAQHTPVRVLQASPVGGASVGTVTYSYVDDIGRVVVGHQASLDVFTVQISIISGNERFTGPPALSDQAGSIQVAAQYADSDVWASSQTAPGAGTWKPWTDIGGSMAAPPAAGSLSTGTSVLFAVDVAGGLWAFAQSGAVPFWRNLGDANLVGTPVVVPVRDGLQVFSRDTTGAIATITYRTDGSTSGFSNLGGSGVGAPAVVVSPGFRLRVFARAADGQIVTKQQDQAGVFPATWDPVGTLVAAGVPTAILDPGLGRVAVVARGQDNLIYASFETAQGSGVFGNWTAVNTPDLASATDPTVAPLRNGSSEFWIIVYRTINGELTIYDRRGLPGSMMAG